MKKARHFLKAYKMLPLQQNADILPLVEDEQKSAADEAQGEEIELILSALQDVKSKSGYGNVHILIYAGAVHDVETVIKQKTKKALRGKTRPKP